MFTLIIPCMGRKFFMGQPQWLCRFPDGMTLLERGLEKVSRSQFDEIIIVLYRKDLTIASGEKAIEDILKKHNNIKLCILDNLTKGPAESVYKALKAFNIKGSIVIKDVDVEFEIPVIKNNNFIGGVNIKNYKSDVKHLKQKSFIILNEQGQILDVIEKQLKSEFISLGLYGFKNADLFCKVYENLSDKFSSFEHIYVSHIISYMIGFYEEIFSYVKISSYYAWESEFDWLCMIHNYDTYIIDVDSCGILNNTDFILRILKDLKNGHMNIILLSSLPESSPIIKDLRKIFPVLMKHTNTNVNLIDTLNKLRLIIPRSD